MRTLPETGVTRYETPSDTEFASIRTVAAPLALAWAMWTEPRHLQRWLLGPEGWTMPLCEMDLRPGGAWRWGWRKGDGETMEMTGEFLEVEPPHRLVTTERWGGDWAETVNTFTFEETAPGHTTMTVLMRWPTKADRDRALGTGMADGTDTSYDRLDAYLASLA